MKALISKNYSYRLKFLNKETHQKIFKLVKKNHIISNFQHWWNEYTSPKLQVSLVKINNKCLLTGRSSSISRVYKLSRIQFRNLGRSGLITGLKKSSW